MKNKPRIFCQIGSLNKLNELIDLTKYSKIAVLTDVNLINLYKKQFEKTFLLKNYNLIVIDSGEKQKKIKTVEKVWLKLYDFSFDRNSLLINFGGGMISDLGGFVAGTFMRGINFINIPTTLLSQVDAAIGGKTAINFNTVKNGVGLFINPNYIIIDPLLTESLSDREILSGFAEILKYGILFDQKMFNLLSSKPFLSFSLKELEQLIKKSYFFKTELIKKDFLEIGPRKLLNFGHTIGHAFESLSMQTKSSLTHGEAVAIGMLIESEIAQKSGLLTKDDLEKIKNVINRNYFFKLSKTLNLKNIIEKMKFDKKNVNNQIHWSLPTAIGEALYDQFVDKEIVVRVISNFLKDYKKNVKKN